MTWIDLHLHSTASDGAYAPAKLVEMAHARGLAALALTDHDTIAGHEEARRAAEALGLTFIPGVELEASQGQKIVHLLAYFIDASSPDLVALLNKVRSLREDRNRAMARKLSELGIPIDYDQMREKYGGRTIGRPHFAAELVRRGIVGHLRAAFTKYLGNDAVAYVAREKLASETVIHSIHLAKGLVSLAHPSRIACDSLLEMENLLYRLRDAGLDAIEVRHPHITPPQASEYERQAKKLGLALTGGSDFHALGAVKRGVGFSGQRIPMEWLETLKNRVPKREFVQPV